MNNKLSPKLNTVNESWHAPIDGKAQVTALPLGASRGLRSNAGADMSRPSPLMIPMAFSRPLVVLGPISISIELRKTD